MFDISLLLKSLLIGILLAFPIGPVGIICVRRLLVEGRNVGLASGLGAATADAIYAAITILSLGLVVSFLTLEAMWLRLFGGIFLIGLGIFIFRSHPVSKTFALQERGIVNAFFTTFFITMANPAVLLSFAGVMAGTGLAHEAQTWIERFMVIGGVFAGSASWWLLLAFFHSFAETLDHANIRLLNMITGVILCGFGIFALLSLR